MNYSRFVPHPLSASLSIAVGAPCNPGWQWHLGCETALFWAHLYVSGMISENFSADSRFTEGVGYVPMENLVGHAEILFFSIDAEYPWWEVWEWPFEIRWSRLFKPVR